MKRSFLHGALIIKPLVCLSSGLDSSVVVHSLHRCSIQLSWDCSCVLKRLSCPRNVPTYALSAPLTHTPDPSPTFKSAGVLVPSLFSPINRRWVVAISIRAFLHLVRHRSIMHNSGRAVYLTDSCTRAAIISRYKMLPHFVRM